MPTAPRYQPDGVRVGEMPVPTVKADMSGANTMAAIGDTIATLGKAADVYQHRQRMRQVYDDTIGEEAYQKWERDRESDYNTFKIEAQGTNVPDKRTWFAGQVNGDVSAYTKDLKPEQVAAFEKRRSFRADTFTQAADNHALIKTNEHVIKVSTDEYNGAMNDAAIAKAGGDEKSFWISMGRANDAHARRQTLTGEKFDQMDDVYNANAGALKILADGKDFEATAAFYEQNKGSFGRHEKSALIVSDDAVNEVYSREAAGNAVFMSTGKHGLIDWDKAVSTLYASKDMNAARMDKSMRNIAHARTAEDKARTEAAQSINAKLDEHLLRGGQGNTFIADPGVQAALSYMEPTARASVMDRAAKGRTFSMPAASAYMAITLKSGKREDAEAARRYMKDNIGFFTGSDIEKFGAEIMNIGKREATELEKAHDTVIGEISRERYLPRPSKEHPTLSEKEMSEWQVADEISNKTIRYLKDNKLEINETNVKHGYAVVTAKLDRVNGGWLSGGVDVIRASDISKGMPAFTADDDRAAGVVAGDSVVDTDLKRERYLRQKAATKEAEAQKAAEDQPGGYENIWDRPFFSDVPIEGNRLPLTGSKELSDYLDRRRETQRSKMLFEQKRRADAAAGR